MSTGRRADRGTTCFIRSGLTAIAVRRRTSLRFLRARDHSRSALPGSITGGGGTIFQTNSRTSVRRSSGMSAETMASIPVLRNFLSAQISRHDVRGRESRMRLRYGGCTIVLALLVASCTPNPPSQQNEAAATGAAPSTVTAHPTPLGLAGTQAPEVANPPPAAAAAQTRIVP